MTDREIAKELQGIADAIRDSLTPAGHAEQVTRLTRQIAEQQADIDQLREALEQPATVAGERTTTVADHGWRMTTWDQLRTQRDSARAAVSEYLREIDQLREALEQARGDKLLADARVQRDQLQAIANAARDEVTERDHEITKLRHVAAKAELAAMGRSRTSAGELSDAVARLNEVIERQIDGTQGAGSGARRAVDIRRRQLAKYPPEHDRRHGKELVEAALALADPDEHTGYWPWGDERFHELADSPDRLAHAAALLMAAFDAQQAAR